LDQDNIQQMVLHGVMPAGAEQALSNDQITIRLSEAEIALAKKQAAEVASNTRDTSKCSCIQL
jgi:hypothetical protein